MIKLTSLVENLRSGDDGYYYHVTLMPFIKHIQTKGLVITPPKRTVTNYKEYSKGKIFLCDIGVVDWWKDKIEQHAFHHYDDEQFHEVAVIRIKKDNLSDVYVDKVGSEDSRGECYYVTKNISPNIIEY